MRVTCSAPGKLVLLGEYVVLEGAPALVAAMNRRAIVRAETAPQFSLTVPALQVEAAEFSLLAGQPLFADPQLQTCTKLRYFRALTAAVAATATAAGGALRPCALHLDTTPFYLPAGDGGANKLGLGSSAALCVALLSAYLEHAGLLGARLPDGALAQPQALLRQALKVHAQAQFNVGSGVDVAASVYGGLLRFLPARGDDAGPQLRALPWLTGFSLVIVWSGQSASTPAMLQRVADLKAAQPQRYWALYEKLATYAHAGADFWALRDGSALCQVVDAYYACLGELGDACEMTVVTEAHAEIYRRVRKVGGFYKTSGAGGGDVGVALCSSPRIAERVVRALRRSPYAVLPIDIDARGLQVEVA